MNITVLPVHVEPEYPIAALRQEGQSLTFALKLQGFLSRFLL
jgi:hypothetical protein